MAVAKCTDDDAAGCDDSRLRGSDCSVAVDGRQMSSCRQDPISASTIQVPSELGPDQRLLARPAALRQPPDMPHHAQPEVRHSPLMPHHDTGALHEPLDMPHHGPSAYCSPGSFYYGSGSDLSGSCRRASTFCRGAGSLTRGGLTPGSDEDDSDGHVASSEEEESKPRIWSLADVATSCRGGLRAGGASASCMTGSGGHIQNGGGFLPWSGSGYYPAPTPASTGLYPSYYQAAAAVVQQKRAVGLRPSEMLGAESHHAHQLLSQDHTYLHHHQQTHHQQQQQLASRNSSFSPGNCSQQPAVVAASQFSDVIGFCAAGLCTSSISVTVFLLCIGYGYYYFLILFILFLPGENP